MILLETVCSVPGCDTPFVILDPVEEDTAEPLCPRHQKARLVQTETPGCDDPDVWTFPLNAD